MSSIDERIVQMEFDNSLFDKNVESSIKTLEKLNVALKMDGIDKNLADISSSVNKMDFSKMEAGILALQNRFSTLGIMTMQWTQDFAKGIENIVGGAIKKITALPRAAVNQIMTGGMGRATKIDQAKFKLEGLHIAWEDIEKDISYGVDQTAYGLDAAASAASQLAASGVKFGEAFGDTGNSPMAKALRGISGVAAMTSSTYEEISPIFTKVAGVGRLYATELNSLSFRGINGAESIAQYLREVKGQADATEQTVHDMITKGQIDFATFSEAMDYAFGAQSKEANKTFEGSLANMKAALSKIGQPIFQAYRKNMTDVFNATREGINKIKKFFEDASSTNEKGMGTFTALARVMESIKNVVVGVINFVSNDLGPVQAIAGGLTNVFNWLADAIGGVASIFGTASETVSSGTQAIADAAEKVTAPLEDIDALIDRIWKGEFGNGESRFKAIDDLYGIEGAGKAVQNRLNELAGSDFRYADAADLTASATEKAGEAMEETVQKIESVAETKNKFVSTMETIGHTIASVFDEKFFIAGWNWMIKANNAVKSAASIFGNFIGSVFLGAINGIIGVGKTIASVFATVTGAMFDGITNLGLWLNKVNAFEKLQNFFEKFGNTVYDIFAFLSNWAITGFKATVSAFSSLGTAIANVGGKVGEFFSSLKETKGYKRLSVAFMGVKKSISSLNEKAMTRVTEFFEGFKNLKIKLPKLDIKGLADKAGEALGKLGDKIVSARASVRSFFEDVKANKNNPLNRLYTYFSGLTAQGILDSAMAKLTIAKNAIVSFFKENQIVAKAQSILANAMVAVQDVASTVFSNLASLFGKVGNAALGVVSNVKDFWSSFKETEGFQIVRDSVFSIFTNLGETISKVKTSVTDFFKSFLASAKELKLPEIKLPSLDMKVISEKAGKALEYLSGKLADVRRSITDFFTNIKIDENNPLHKIYTYFSSLSLQGIIDSVVTKFKRAGNAISKFFKDTKIATKAQTAFTAVVAKVKETAPTVFSGLVKVISKIGSTIIGAKDKVIEFWNAFKETKGFEILKSGAINAFNGLIELLGKAGGKVGEFFKKLFGDAKDFKMPEISMDGIAEKVSSAIEWIKEKFEGLKTAVSGFFSGEGETIGSKALGAIADFFSNVDWIGGVDTVTNALNNAKEAIVSFFSTVGKLIFGEEVDAAPFDGVAESSESLGEALEGTAGKMDALSSMAETTKEIASKLYKVIQPLAGLLFGFKIGQGLLGVFDFLKGFGGIFKNADKVLKQTSKAIKRVSKAISFEIASKGIRNVAIAFGILAASMMALGQLTPDKFDVAVKGLWAITFALIALMGAFALFFGKGIFSGGGAGEALSPLQDFEKIMADFGTKMSKALNKFGIAAIIISVVAAIKILIDCVKELSEIDTPALWKGGFALAAIGAALYAMVSGLTKSAGDFSFGKGMGMAALMLAISGAVYILASAVAKLGKMKLGDLIKGGIAVGALITVLGGFVFIADGMDLSGILPLIGLIAEILIGILLLSFIPIDKIAAIGSALGKAFLSIAALTAAIGYAEGKLADVSGGKLAGSLFGIGLIIAEVMGGLAALTFLPEDNIAKIDQIADGLQTIFNSVALVVAALALFEGMDDGGLSGITSPAAAKTLKIVGIVMGIGFVLSGLSDFIGEQTIFGESKTLLGKITKIIEDLQEPFTAIGKAIGGVIGGIGAGLVEGLTGSTPEELIDGFMNEIKNFPETIQGWVDGITKLIEDTKAAYEDGKIDKGVIDDFAGVIESVKTTSENIWAIADTLWSTRVDREAYATTTESGDPDLLLGGESMTKWLTAWATAFSGFADTIAGTTLDPSSAIEKFTSVTTLLTSFQGVLTAANDLKGMDEATAKIEQLPAVGSALVRYSWSMLLLNPAAVENTENAVNIINAAAGAAIENGQKSIEGFTAIVGAGSALAQMSTDLPGFGTALKDFCKEVDGMEAYNDIMPSVEATGNIINSLSAGAIANGQQNMTIPEGFTGFVSALSSISTDLPGFGEGLKGFAENVDGLQEHAGAVEASKVAAGIINSLAGEGVTVGQNNIISGIGSDGNLITTLSTYSGDLEGFATALTVYSAIIDEMKVGAVFKTHAAAAMIVALTNAIPDTSSGLMGLLFGSGDTSIENFTTYLPKIAQAFVDFSDIAEQFDETNAQKVVNAFKTIVETADLLANYSERTGGEMASVESNAAVEMVSSAIEALSFEDLGSVQELQDLVTAGEAIGESIKKSLSEGIINGLTKAGEGSTAGGGESAGNSALSKLITSMFGDTKTATAEIENMSIGADISAAIIAAIQKGINEPVETAIDLTTFLTAIADGVTAGEDAMIVAGETLASAIASGILSARGSASNAGYYTGLSGASGARGSYNAFYSAGSYAGQGFASGILSQVSRAVEAARQMANSAAAATNTTLKVNSPSKVFMKIGSSVTEGFSKGIIDNTYMATEASEDMAVLSVGSAEDALKNRTDQMFKQASLSIAAAYAYINEVANQSLNSQPVITPVLDMTNLQNGMYSMGSLWNMSLNNPLAYANTTYPGSYQYANTLRANNEYVTQTELRGIRSDLKQLGEAITNMNMVLDSGTLVGQLTPGIDRGLGSIAGMKERWA